MANNEIKQKIVLEGEQQYRNAIKDAQRNLKTLRSELKAETAELGKNATEQQKAETKVKSLKKQIAEQEKIVKANRDALEEVRQKYGDNADAVAKYEQKLNDSRTALANMKNELENVGEGFKKVEGSAEMATVASKSVADTLERLGGIGDTIADGIENAFTGMLNIVKGAVSEVWQLIAETAAKANNWTDVAGIFGTTAEEIQNMERAINGIGAGKFDSFVATMNRLSFGGKEKKVAELLGVSDANYEDKLEYTMAVIKAIQRFQRDHTKDQQDNMMTEIFGAKKSADVTWLLNNWDDILEKRDEYIEKGYTMNADEIETMNQVQLEIFDIEQKWDALKDKIALGFGTVTLDIQAEVSRGLDALAKYFNAESDEERDAALDELEESILGLFEVAAKAIEDGVKMLADVAERLKESENPTAQALGNILSGLVDALKWLTEDNMKNVVSALEILAAFWAGSKALAMIANIAAFASHISTLVTAKGIGAAAAGAAAGGSWGAAFSAAVMKAAPWLIGLYELVKPSDTGDEKGNSTLIDKEGNLTQEAVDAGFTQDENGNLKYNRDDEIIASVQAFWDLYRTGKLDKTGMDEMRETLLDDALFDSLVKAMYQFNLDNPNWKSIEDLPSTFFSDTWKFNTNGGNTGDALSGEDARSMTEAVNNMPKAVAKGMSSIRVDMDGQTVGRMVAPYVSQYIAAEAIGG